MSEVDRADDGGAAVSSSNHREFRRIGPPGCGKTTWLSRQAARAVEASGVPAHECRSVLISSLTRAAASEVRGRGLGLPREQIGTLHSHAYRALGCPDLVTAEALENWNAVCSPQMRRTVAELGDDPGAGKSPGDDLHRRYTLARCRLRDMRTIDPRVARYAEQYDSWKRISGLLDFSDLIDEAWRDCPTAPGNPSIIFLDEAQDHDRQQFRLARRWAESCESFVVVGDPDQNLYSWRGSEPEAFYDADIPAENQSVLSQSYRVPRSVHAMARRIVTRISSRHDAPYLPRDEEGEVVHLGRSFVGKQADDCVKEILDRYNGSESIMFLASCDYMMSSVIATLREHGIPFHNPYRADGRFNPLASRRGSTSAAERVLAFARVILDDNAARPPFSDGNPELYSSAPLYRAELLAIVGACKTRGWLKDGAKKQIQAMTAAKPDAHVFDAQLEEWFVSEEALKEFAKADLNWFRERLSKAKRKAVEFAMRIYEQGGAAALIEKPRVIVGTIHSVKGGEADVVVLAPNLSPAGLKQYHFGDRDALWRMFYVGATRARHSLVLCDPRSSCIQW